MSDFASTWKGVIVQVSGEVMNQFSNFKTGGEILRQVLTQLAVLYGDFGDIVKQYYKSLAKDIVPRPTLTYEIKKYTPTFD